MKSKELRDLSNDEVVEHIRTQRRDAFGLRFQHATGELENTAGLRTAKRGLARALTIAQQRGIDTHTLRHG
ncbi:MAG TPA: 50S ribosomal protein L29 [Solirubrobacteraceae bacterium]